MNISARTFTACAAALMMTASATQAAIVTVDVYEPTANQIADDPTLADATIIDLLVDSETDLLLSYDVELSTVGTIYNHSLEEADDAAPNPTAVISFPALGADSHYAYGDKLGGDLSTLNSEFPFSVGAPLPIATYNGLLARITILNDADATISGTVYVSTDGTTSTAIAFTTPSGIPGDLNGDGFVGLDDLDIILGAWNQNVPPADEAADPSGDGFVGLDDLDIVLNHWNEGTPPAAAVVPEPATLALLGLGGLAALRRR